MCDNADRQTDGYDKPGSHSSHSSLQTCVKMSTRANRVDANQFTLNGPNHRPFILWGKPLFEGSCKPLDTAKSMKVNEMKILTNYYQLN
jgi:hypothetical protein